MKRDVVIVFGVTGNYVFALANVLIGMKKHCKKFWDDIIVYHTDITEKEQQDLNKILKCNFIDFEKLSSKLNVRKEVVETYSLLTFARFECFNLLKKYKKVIWQDVDILVQKDFSSLLEYGDKSGYAATISVDGFYVESNFNKLLPDYDMFRPLYNAGILCLSDKLPNYEKMADWCYEKTNEYYDVIRFGEQAIINLLIQDFNIKVENIDILKYCCHPTKKEAVSATIIHAYGSNKFWNYEPYMKMFPEWIENDKEWQKISHSDKSNVSNFDKKEEKEDNEKIQQKPLVSVIMSVYERYNYLKESINSILNQTYNNLELIIVVEKSSKTNEVVNFIKKIKDKRIKIIINEEKLGFAESLNVAIRNSNGEYIARMDDDDISLPERIEKQVNFMEEYKDIDICGSYIQMFMKSDAIETKPLRDEELKTFCLTNNPFFHPTVIMRKRIFDKYNLYYSPDYFTEDYELWVRSMKYVKFANIGEVLLKFRASGENITVNRSLDVHNSVIKVMSDMYKEYLKLDITNNELELLYGKTSGLFSHLYNLDEALVMYDTIVDKIIEANKKTGFFDQYELEKYFQRDNDKPVKTIRNNIGNPIKRFIKFLFRPIYRRLMNRIENLINLKISENNLLMDFKINEIKEKINKDD